MTITIMLPTSAAAFTQFLNNMTDEGHPTPSPELIQFFYVLDKAGYHLDVAPVTYPYHFKLNGARVDFVTAQTGSGGLYHVDLLGRHPQVINYDHFDRRVDYVVVACWNSMAYRLEFYLFDADKVPTAFGANDEFAATGLYRWQMFCEAPAKLAQLMPPGLLAALPAGVRPMR